MSAVVRWGKGTGSQRRQTGEFRTDNLDLPLLRLIIAKDDDERIEWITIDLDKSK